MVLKGILTSRTRSMEYLLAGAALAEMATIVANAVEMDIRLDKIEVGAIGHRDLRGIYEIGRARPQFQEFTYDVDIDSNADEESIKTLISKSEGRCPGYNTLVNPVKVSTNISLNGKRV
ncbi:MAG: OsmC family protein [Thaumarchaeota archaeon]|nr:OsmC family protein [Nitrososphaerota archaeon]